MWKALLSYLPLDERVRKLGIPLVLGCNFCVEHLMETLNHILSTGYVVCLVWKKAATTLGILNIENEKWRVKIRRW